MCKKAAFSCFPGRGRWRSWPLFGQRTRSSGAGGKLRGGNVGALIIAYTILGFPYWNYGTIYTKSIPVLIIKAPIAWLRDDIVIGCTVQEQCVGEECPGPGQRPRGASMWSLEGVFLASKRPSSCLHHQAQLPENLFDNPYEPPPQVWSPGIFGFRVSGLGC